MIKLTSPGAITALPGFDEGLFAVQDLSASQRGSAFASSARLDDSGPLCCAGDKDDPTGRGDRRTAKIVATDIDANRV